MCSTSEKVILFSWELVGPSQEQVIGTEHVMFTHVKKAINIQLHVR